MRLGLIGSTGHWHTYAAALGRVPGLTLVAVAAAGPEETTGAFDHAPGLTAETHRYDDARRMLDSERLDVVQVCCRCDRIPVWARACVASTCRACNGDPSRTGGAIQWRT